MAKRLSQDIKNKASRSKKTTKRLATKKATLAAKIKRLPNKNKKINTKRVKAK